MRRMMRSTMEPLRTDRRASKSASSQAGPLLSSSSRRMRSTTMLSTLLTHFLSLAWTWRERQAPSCQTSNLRTWTRSSRATSLRLSRSGTCSKGLTMRSKTRDWPSLWPDRSRPNWDCSRGMTPALWARMNRLRTWRKRSESRSQRSETTLTKRAIRSKRFQMLRNSTLSLTTRSTNWASLKRDWETRHLWISIESHRHSWNWIIW